MSNLSDIISSLANTSGTKAKQAILEANKNNTLLKMLFYATEDQQIKYYITSAQLSEPSVFDNLDTDPRELTEADIRTIITMLDSRQLTGHAARDWLQGILDQLVPEDQKLLKMMIDRDLECRVGTSLCNRVWPGLIYEYPCLLSIKMDDKQIARLKKEGHKEYIVQTKADGGRSNAHNRTNQDKKFFSRNGNELTTHGVMDQIMTAFDGYMVDGELVVITKDGLVDRQTGNGIFNKAVRGTISKEEAEQFHFVVWDLVPMENFDAGKDETPYKVRLNKLANIIRGLGVQNKISLVDTKFVNTLEEVDEYYQEQLKLGFEGAILKTVDLVWENDRSKNCIKMKVEDPADLLCIGFTPHTKDPSLIGSLLLTTQDGLLETNCGSGLDDEDRLKDPSEYVGKIISVKYNTVIKSKDSSKKASLFLPVFQQIRLDKTEANYLKDL